MTLSRVDAIKAGYAAFDRGEFDLVTRGYHDDAVFDFSEVDMFHGLLTGKATFPRTWASLREAWEDWEHRVERVEDVSADQVLVETVQVGRGKESGVEVTRRLWHVYDYRGDKVARVRGFASRREADAAIGAHRESPISD